VVAHTQLCESIFEGVRPVLAVTDARSPHRSTVALWKQLHLRELNSALNPAMAAKTVAAFKRARKSVAFALALPSMTEVEEDEDEGIVERFGLEAVSGKGPSRAPARAVGISSNEIVLDLGSAAHLSDDTVVELALTNRSACTCSWALALPADLSWQPELWAMPHNPTFTEEHHRLVQENRTFEISPKRGELAPGATNIITLTYRHGLVDRHSIPVLMTQPGTSAPAVRLRLVGETLAGGNPHLDFPAPTHRFEPVPLGLLEPPVQLYELTNTSDVDAEFELDLSGVEKLRVANYGVAIFECGMASGVVPAQSSIILPWRFQPLEAKLYKVAVGVHICNAPLEEAPYVLTLVAEGIDPRRPAGPEATGTAAEEADRRRHSSRASGQRRDNMVAGQPRPRNSVSILGTPTSSIGSLARRRRQTLSNMGHASDADVEDKGGASGPTHGADVGAHHRETLRLRTNKRLRRLNTLTTAEVDEEAFIAESELEGKEMMGRLSAMPDIAFEAEEDDMALINSEGRDSGAAFDALLAVEAPLKPTLVLQDQPAQLSHTRLNLGPSPLHAVLRRLVFVDNLLTHDRVRFRWRCGQYAGVVRVEPESGEVRPGEAVVCKVEFKPREGVRLYNFDVCCEVWNATKEDERALRLRNMSITRRTEAEYFVISDQGRTGRGRAGGYRGGGQLGDTAGSRAPADTFSGTLPAGAFPHKVLDPGPAPVVTSKLEDRPRSSGPKLQPVVGARSVVVNDTDLRTTRYQVRVGRKNLYGCFSWIELRWFICCVLAAPLFFSPLGV
jgi:hypothetical protein